MTTPPVLLLILDGFGHREECDHNAICLAVVPGDEQLDLKALARATGHRRSELVALPEVLPLTGYVRGGVTAGNVRRYQVWYRNSAAFCTPATFNLTNGLSVTWQP